MKKKLVLGFLATVLVLVGVSGGVYANNSQGNGRVEKLFGLGTSGLFALPNAPQEQIVSGFTFANPNNDEDIIIREVSIARFDGRTVYRGPLIFMPPPGAGDFSYITTMKPREIRVIFLPSYMYKGSGDPLDRDNWLTQAEALALPAQGYTVEIAWEPSSRNNIAPLTGWLNTRNFRNDILSTTSVQMVNLPGRN